MLLKDRRNSKAIETTTASNGKTIKGGNDFMELKMSKTWKRVISFVLAFAMAFSFTPVTTSRAATADGKVTIAINGVRIFDVKKELVKEFL